MPISSSSAQIKSLVNARELGASTQNFVFHGLEFDSREIRGGELFVALPGDKSHGNQFVELALSRGAALVLADSTAPLPEVSEKDRVLLVEDPLAAFWKIAAWWRDQIKLPTLAITGSVGKTTVKEMAAAILLQKGPGTYSLKSHNNHVGVPYTICRASRDHHWLVLEIGMNHSGEIGPLSELARPQVVAVTTVAPAHIGNLGSLEAVADEKLDICKGLDPEGHLLLNAQSNILKERLTMREIPQGISREYFGTGIEGDGAISNIRVTGLEGINFNLESGNETLAITMKVLGRQNAWNAACAARASKLLCPGLNNEQIVSGLARFTAPLMRLNIKYLCDGTVVIDDSYNANPASMAAAIELIADLRNKGQKIGLVLGDMLELGEFSKAYHQEIGDVILAVKPDFVLALGEASSDYVVALDESEVPHIHCGSVNEVNEALKSFAFDFLLVKASRGIGLDQVVSNLLKVRGELPYEPKLAVSAESEIETGNVK